MRQYIEKRTKRFFILFFAKYLFPPPPQKLIMYLFILNSIENIYGLRLFYFIVLSFRCLFIQTLLFNDG